VAVQQPQQRLEQAEWLESLACKIASSSFNPTEVSGKKDTAARTARAAPGPRPALNMNGSASSHNFERSRSAAKPKGC